MRPTAPAKTTAPATTDRHRVVAATRRAIAEPRPRLIRRAVTPRRPYGFGSCSARQSRPSTRATGSRGTPARTDCGRGRLAKQYARGAADDAPRAGRGRRRARGRSRCVPRSPRIEDAGARCLPRRTRRWRPRRLVVPPDDHVAAGSRLEVIVDDGVVGFAAAGHEHDGRTGGIGELYAINLDPQVGVAGSADLRAGRLAGWRVAPCLHAASIRVARRAPAGAAAGRRCGLRSAVRRQARASDTAAGDLASDYAVRWRTHQWQASTRTMPTAREMIDSQTCIVQKWLAGWASTTSWTPSRWAQRTRRHLPRFGRGARH